VNDDIHDFDGTHCAQCRAFLEPEYRDFTHLCYTCWLSSPDTQSFMHYGKFRGWSLDFTLECLKTYQYSRMN
jgi:hypothetical protein